jgi:NAD(P)-dependent dehydrogenase (short-subunit alcohol dehydrogenase family)
MLRPSSLLRAWKTRGATSESPWRDRTAEPQRSPDPGRSRSEGDPVIRELELAGQTLVVIGGSSGIGLETARHARKEGADVIITARNADRVHRAGLELGASIAAFDATDFHRLERFFNELPAPVDHVLVTCPGAYSAPLAEFDVEAARSSVDAHLILPLQVARNAATKVRPGGTLLFTGCTDDPAPAVGLSLVLGLSAALHALTKNLALAVAPVRVNLIAAGFVETPLSAAILGDQLNARREQLRTTLPIRRVVDRADVAALAVHLMTNAAITGATFEIDGGQQLVHA